MYNAALLAGLEIVERHRHYFPARYAPLGRDAAVAYHDIDLRFRNNLPEPIRIIGRVEGENLVFGIRSAHEPSYTVRIECQTRSVKPPQEVVQNRSGKDAGAWRLVNRGHAGFNVATYRIFTAPDGVRKELIAEDSYPAMNRVIRLTEQ